MIIKQYAIVSIATDPNWDLEDCGPDIEEVAPTLGDAMITMEYLKARKGWHKGTEFKIMKVTLEDLD